MDLFKVCGRWVAAQVFRLCDYAVPKDKRVVLVTRPDGDDQGVSICLELKRANWDGEIHWLVHEDPAPFREWQKRRGLGGVDVRFSPLYSIGGIWCYFRANHVFYTHGALFNYAPPKRKVVVNLWHGMPIKKIWRGVAGSQLPKSTFLISTSDFFSGVLMRASGFGPERLLATGLPRNDVLTCERPEATASAKRLRGRADHLIFFLPTYRSSARGFLTEDGTETHTILSLIPAEADRLHAWLERNRCRMIVKPHPMSVNAGKPFTDDAHWAMLDERILFREGLGLYELLGKADLLVTDVSSVYVDFLITGRPQILYFPDRERYEQTRGLLLQPLSDYAPGPIAGNYEELEKSLDMWMSGEDPWRERRMRLRDLMVPRSPRSAAASLVSALGMRSPSPMPSTPSCGPTDVAGSAPQTRDVGR
jgi:CDP-glycerol glycerophosphotransferase (TagB/SpsB family)